MNRVMATTLLACLLNLPVWSKTFLAKIKKHQLSNFLQLSLVSQKQQTIISTSFGDYIVLKELTDQEALKLSQRPQIEYLEEDISIKHFNSSPQDKYYKNQWAIREKSSKAHIQANKTWALNLKGKETVVAVIDSGINLDHPDLKESLWTNEREINGQAGVDDDGNGLVDDIYGYDFVSQNSLPSDSLGHGTHVAGIIAATHNNIGVAGVASENIKIMALKFLNHVGQGSGEGLIKAFDYALKKEVAVINASWGATKYHPLFTDLAKAAHRAGVFLIAAAGNDDNNNDRKGVWPANINSENVISVGNHSSWGRKTSDSNYGKKTVHLFAPGSQILSTYKYTGYRKLSGTSMAAPHVSGAVAMYISMYGMSDFSKIKAHLLNSVTKYDRLEAYCQSGGRLNLYQFMR